MNSLNRVTHFVFDNTKLKTSFLLMFYSFPCTSCFCQMASDTPIQTHAFLSHLATHWKDLFLAVLNIAWTGASAKSCQLWRRNRTLSGPWP